MATNVAMYKPQRTEVRPPEIMRLPLCWPLSWLIGATPTSRAICFSESVPISGNSAKHRADETLPIPLTDCKISFCVANRLAVGEGLNLLVEAFNTLLDFLNMGFDI